MFYLNTKVSVYSIIKKLFWKWNIYCMCSSIKKDRHCAAPSTSKEPCPCTWKQDVTGVFSRKQCATTVTSMLEISSTFYLFNCFSNFFVMRLNDADRLKWFLTTRCARVECLVKAFKKTKSTFRSDIKLEVLLFTWKPAVNCGASYTKWM